MTAVITAVPTPGSLGSEPRPPSSHSPLYNRPAESASVGQIEGSGSADDTDDENEGDPGWSLTQCATSARTRPGPGVTDPTETVNSHTLGAFQQDDDTIQSSHNDFWLLQDPDLGTVPSIHNDFGVFEFGNDDLFGASLQRSPMSTIQNVLSFQDQPQLGGVDTNRRSTFSGRHQPPPVRARQSDGQRGQALDTTNSPYTTQFIGLSGEMDPYFLDQMIYPEDGVVNFGAFKYRQMTNNPDHGVSETSRTIPAHFLITRQGERASEVHSSQAPSKPEVSSLSKLISPDLGSRLVGL